MDRLLYKLINKKFPRYLIKLIWNNLDRLLVTAYFKSTYKIITDYNSQFSNTI